MAGSGSYQRAAIFRDSKIVVVGVSRENVSCIESLVKLNDQLERGYPTHPDGGDKIRSCGFAPSSFGDGRIFRWREWVRMVNGEVNACMIFYGVQNLVPGSKGMKVLSCHCEILEWLVSVTPERSHLHISV